MKRVAYAVVLLLCAAIAGAQEFPNRAVRIVVPFTPAGPVDLLARIIAEKLGARWRQPVVVENRPGAGTVIGTEAVAKAPPDGHTLLLAVTSHAINATLIDKLPFHPVKDFAPVVLAATAPNILAATPGLPANSLRELIALAKANPGKLNAASPGKGTTLHLAAEMLKSVAGIDFAIIHYKGAQPAMNALLAGEVGFMFDAGTVIPQVNAGKLKAFAVTSPKRSIALPDQPTMAQAGLPGFEVVSWYGFLAPGATPRRVVEALNREINGVLNETDARERIVKIGLEPASSTPEELDQFIRDQIARWGKVIETSGVKSE